MGTIADQMQMRRLKQRQADAKILDTLKRQDEERLAEKILTAMKLQGFVEGKIDWNGTTFYDVKSRVEKMLRALALRMGFDIRENQLEELRQEAIFLAFNGVKVKGTEEPTQARIFAIATSQAFYAWINRLKFEVNGGRMGDADPYGLKADPLQLEEVQYLLQDNEMAERVFSGEAKVRKAEAKSGHWTHKPDTTTWDGTAWGQYEDTAPCYDHAGAEYTHA